MGDAIDEKAEVATAASAYPAHTAAFADALAGRDVCAIGMAGIGASSVVAAFIAHLERRRASDARRVTTAGALPRPPRQSELVRRLDDAAVRSLVDSATVDAHTRIVCATKLAPPSVTGLAKLFPRAQRVVHTYHDFAGADAHYVVHRFHEPLFAPVDFDAMFRAHFRLDEVGGGDSGDADAENDGDDDAEDGHAEHDQGVDEHAAILGEEKS